jgi:hypothetical protein
MLSMIRIFKLVLLLVVSQVAFGQAPTNYTNINGRYRWIAGMFDSTFHIPKGTTPSLRTGGSTNAGAVFYNTSDSSVYTYTGTQWIKLRGTITDTTSLSNRINLKLNISDTASMLSPYLRKVDTTNKFVTQVYKKNGSDSVFYVKGGVHTWAFNDSTGSPGGGGGGKIYYFNGGVSMGTFGGFTMYELGDTANTGTAANFTRATTGNIANFITDPGKPGLLQIPAGVWSIDAYLSETGGGSNNAEIYVQVEKWDGSTITTIATSPIEQITNGSVIDLYSWSVSIPTTALAVTDRIIIQFYIQNTNGKTVTLYTQNGYVGEVHTTFTTGIGAINGLTAPAQYLVTGTSGTDFNINSATATHTFNLPTASSTNRGALSSTDWTTFNNKGSVSSVATNTATGITGGTITTTGTLAIDTLLISTRAWRQKGVDSVAALISSNISGTTNYIPKFTSSSAIGNSNLQTDASGNLGLGVTPSAWNSVYKAINIGLKGFIYSRTDNEETSFGVNWYRDAAGGYVYATNGTAQYYTQSSGSHYWLTAPSGTAGNAISFTQAMTLFSTGNLTVGGTTDNGYKLDVTGTGRFTGTISGGNNFELVNAGGPYVLIGEGTGVDQYGAIDWDANNNRLRIATQPFAFGANGGQITLTTGGNVGIGTTSPTGKLMIEATGNHLFLRASSAAAGKYWNFDVTSANQLYIINNAGTQYLTITDGGNVGIGTTNPTSLLHLFSSTAGVSQRIESTATNGEPSVNFYGKNSSGTVRSFAIKYDNTDIIRFGTSDAIPIRFETTDIERMRITSGGYVGINEQSPNSYLHVKGSLRLPIAIKTATYTLTADDYTVVFDLNGNATANLPDATTIPGRIYVIKINRTNVANTLTIDPNGAQTIDGNATLDLQCQQAITIQSDGTNWRVIGDYLGGLNCL